MKFIKNWGCKIRYVIGLNTTVITNTFELFFAIIGFLISISEIERQLLGTNFLLNGLKENLELLCGGILIISWYKNSKSLSYNYKINGTDIEINLKIDDIFSSSNAIVIPTCTTFDTRMEDEFISVRSIQGKFQTKYFINNLETLDSLIERSLEKYYPNVAIDYEGKTIGKTKKYPVGTVSKITHDDKHFYLLAIADVNKCGKTINTSYNNITEALNGLWCHMVEHGHVENISIPLIGTGRAGIQGVTREKIIKEIIVSFIAFNQSRKITEKLVIYIHPCDVFDKGLDLENIKEFLYYKSKYGYIENPNVRTGKIVNLKRTE